MKTVFDSIEFAHTPPNPLLPVTQLQCVYTLGRQHRFKYYSVFLCKVCLFNCCLTVVGESKPFSDGEAKMLYVYCSSHLMMTMIIIHSFHKLSLKPIKALVLLNLQSSVIVAKHICSDLLHVYLTNVKSGKIKQLT